MSGKSSQHALRTWTRKHLKLVTPKASVSLKRNKQCTLHPHKPGRHHWHQLQKAVEVAEAAQGKPKRHKQLLIGTLLPRHALQKLSK
jgi:hypothetical protein